MLDALHRSTALRRPACARRINEDAAHQLSGQRKEMHPVLPIDVLSPRQTQIQFGTSPALSSVTPERSRRR